MQINEGIPYSVIPVINQALEKRLNLLLLYAKECQSPIEQMLVVSLIATIQEFKDKFKNSCYVGVKIWPQQPIEQYKTDIGILVMVNGIEIIKLAVECDGHDFHEKTKEQVAKDKKRERDIVKNGFIVIRFTGSEIHKDPWNCADQIWKIVINKADEMKFIDCGD